MAARLCLLLALLVPLAAQARALEVALTVDTVPGEPHHLAAIQSAFQARGLPSVTGFVTGAHLTSNPAAMQAVRNWIGAGNRVGNHTYSQADLRQLPLADYLADIDRNESVLETATGDTENWRVYRYPNLLEGTDAANRSAIRNHLAARGYRIAPVTIDLDDNLWADAYARCRAKGDDAMAITVQRGVVADALLQVLWADEMARALLGRPIKHIMVLHSRGLLADTADDLLQALSEHHIAIIDLRDALQDPAYATDIPADGPMGGPFLEQLASVHPVTKAPEPVPHPIAWLSQVCR